MGRASRKRAEQRASVTVRVFPLQRPQRAAPARAVPWSARSGLERLAELHQQQVELECQIEDAARAVVAKGASWADLGRALGISRQGARQRYG